MIWHYCSLFNKHTQEGPKKHVDIHSIRNVHLQNGLGFDKREEPIAFRNNTLNANTGGMTLESALFPFLFPHGIGAYNGQTTSSEYLKYHMSTLFFFFTLYKPYLLYVYDIHHSVQFLNFFLQTCLDREIKQTKHTHPNMNEAEVLQHVTKYNLSSSIERAPRWYKSQQQDLLAMVEKFRMPNFFLTLTDDKQTL